jgi:hypothetical protein
MNKARNLDYKEKLIVLRTKPVKYGEISMKAKK